MVQEKLIIHDFGGIADMELEFKRINLLIGPQASGKSLVMKLAYLFKQFLAELHHVITDGGDRKEIKQRLIDRFIKYFPPSEWGSGEFHILYQVDAVNIQVRRKNSKSVTVDFSSGLTKVINQAIRIHDDADIQDRVGDRLVPLDRRQLLFIWDQINALLKKDASLISTFSQRMVPAGRSFFSAIQVRSFSWMADDAEIDPMLIDYGALMERYKFIYLKTLEEEKVSTEFQALAAAILKSRYGKEKDREYLLHEDDRKVTLGNASSGQQAALPIVMLATSIADGGAEPDDGVCLYIEEPEAHIFPDSQKQIVRLQARTFNKHERCQLFINTHSPYILTAFNNLLEAGQVVRDHPDRAARVHQIVPSEEVLSVDDFAPYIIREGKAVLMKDPETGLLAANMIDDVSDEIGSEFEALLDLAYE